jgi:hypothetical protein
MDTPIEVPPSVPPPPPGPKKLPTWVIVVIVALVLCCLCVGAAGLIFAWWEPIQQALGLAALLPGAALL